MLQKTRGIVLHTTPYAEASLIVKAYTEGNGMQSFLVHGVRKQKARFAANLFQPLSLIEVIAYFKKPGGLHRVSDVTASPAFSSIPYDLVKSTMSIFMAEVVYKSIREEESNPELFHFLDHAIQILDLHAEPISRFHLSFMVQFTKYLGFFPHGRFSTASPYFDLREGCFCNEVPPHAYFIKEDLSSKLDILLETRLEEASNMLFSASERRGLLNSLIAYYELHHTQGQSIRSHGVLAEVMGA